MGDRNWELWDRPGVVPKIEQMWNTPLEIDHRDVLSRLSLKYLRDGDLFLEVGCGTGLMYKNLSKIAKIAYTGVDTSKEMLRSARAAFPGVAFQEGDGYALPFPDRSFDVVAAYDVLQHLPDIAGFIREMIRASRRTVLFTLLTADRSVREDESILGNRFIVKWYSMAEAEAKVKEGAGEATYEVIPILDKIREVIKSRSNLWVLTKKLA